MVWPPDQYPLVSSQEFDIFGHPISLSIRRSAYFDPPSRRVFFTTIDEITFRVILPIVRGHLRITHISYFRSLRNLLLAAKKNPSAEISTANTSLEPAWKSIAAAVKEKLLGASGSGANGIKAEFAFYMIMSTKYPDFGPKNWVNSIAYFSTVLPIPALITSAQFVPKDGMERGDTFGYDFFYGGTYYEVKCVNKSIAPPFPLSHSYSILAPLCFSSSSHYLLQLLQLHHHYHHHHLVVCIAIRKFQETLRYI